MNSCKDPTCVYSKEKNKCVKPNPYVQFIANCKSLNNTFNKCKEIYSKNNEKIKNEACNYYRKNKNSSKEKTCPPNRRPVNDNCNNELFPILKSNKYGIKCCYKDKIKPKKKTSSISTSINPFEDISNNKILIKNKNKIPQIIHNYQYKTKPIKAK
jgi:hypothetical protein